MVQQPICPLSTLSVTTANESRCLIPLTNWGLGTTFLSLIALLSSGVARKFLTLPWLKNEKRANSWAAQRKEHLKGFEQKC